MMSRWRDFGNMAEVGESSSGGGAKDEVRESRRKKLSEYRAGKLAEWTLEGKWNKVVETYTKYPGAQTQRVTEDNDNTALHVAINLKKEKVVKELVEAIIKFENEEGGVAEDEEALRVQNKKGDTPLHLAASRGFTKICMYIIGDNEERMHLLRLENKKGETPFFLAALNWNAHAFAYLSSVADNLLFTSNELADDTKRLLTRGTSKEMKDRESILHCAINSECFDLAFIIASNYTFLTMHAHSGITPLHVLAQRPSAFKSTTKLSFLKQMLYHIIPVRKLDAHKKMEIYKEEIQRPRLSNDSKKIGEKRACSWLLGKLLRNFPGQRHEYDEENASKCFGKCGTGFLPPNYDTFLQFLISVYVHSSLPRLVNAFSEVRGTKQKHVWSDQLLRKLMENPFQAFTGKQGEEPSHHEPDEWSYFDPDEDIFKDFVGRNKENSPKPENTTYQNPSDTRGGAPTDQNDSKEGTKSGDLVLKCCDCVISNVKNTEDCERMKPMRPQFLMKCGCGRADCKSNIAAAIAVADHSTEDASDDSKKETPYLLAAKHGIIEMVTVIQEKIPSVIHSTNSKNQNVLLVAVKNRQPQVVLELKKQSEAEVWDNLVIGVDDDENTLLHLAAEGLKGDKSWQIAGSDLQMMWDIKWYQYIKSLVPQRYYFRSNRESKTAWEIFQTSHESLVQKGSEWLKETSQACSVVAALVAGVSFATVCQVPGGTNDKGQPQLEGKAEFHAFAIASVIGLCCSGTGLIMFLCILTSRKEAKDFRRELPLKLLLGLSSLFVSIVAMFVSFCSGNFFILSRKYESFLLSFYAATSIPVAIYALAQFPLYFDLLVTILTRVPWASKKGDNF